MGFEPTEPCGSTAFKAAPFDRSGTPPGGSVYVRDYAAADAAIGSGAGTGTAAGCGEVA